VHQVSSSEATTSLAANPVARTGLCQITQHARGQGKEAAAPRRADAPLDGLCAEAILDRAWGRPAIAVLHADVSKQPPTPVLDEGTPEQQRQRIQEVCQILVDCGAVRVLPAGSKVAAPVGKNTDVLPS